MALENTMSLKLSDVRRIAGEVAREQFPDLEIVAAVAEGDSGYTEVLMTVRGCRQEPCQIMIGLNRDASESDFRAAVRERVQEHLDEHRTAV
jgi:hypothetical protein